MTIRNLLTGDTGFAPLRAPAGEGDPPPTKPWYDGKITDPTEIGRLQNRKWDQGDPADVAVQAIRAHHEAEQHIGVPADRILKLPANAEDKDGWKTVWQRLGAPKDPKELDPVLAEAKFADGTEVDQQFKDAIRNLAVENNLPVDAARSVMKSLIKLVEEGDTEDVAVTQAKLAQQKDALTTEWGAGNVETNMVIARRTAAHLGLTEEMIAAAENTLGYVPLMKMMHIIGTKTGEADFLRGDTGASKVLTKEQAAERRRQLENDPDWSKRYLAGGVKENEELQALIAIEKQ